ncbi:transcriptional regulator, AraC family [Nitrobacter hamburgensis X14]|uniref:Transcriptional regulator, AraC family n=1 Tax=Nitrobacter hamburgensis (strain DSM 10229 / NCIMB 13809 / X14) TaxID=323097 RepID=Q1QJ52_NITHX|nr:helix-turn-helix domain-containing protein [Nitrobacter hamburgensis]ABE63745.1 transcriptional regulator, AraC family [Nitrobacter hamburgensis X14]
MVQRLWVSSCGLNGFEGLHQAVQGSHIDVMQLGHGKMRGTLSHVGIGEFSLSVGSFNLGVRTQRTSSDEKLIVGMLLSAKDRVTHFAFDMRPADVLVIPPAIEHDGIFHGASSYAALRFDLSDVVSMFAGEARLSDPATWYEKNRYRANQSAQTATARLPQIVSRLAQHQDALTEASADFWKRAIVDCFTATIFQSLPPDETRTLPSALRLVHNVEDYLAAADARPVHVSELCAAFRVSRRGLHRAFHDVFGVGPVTFLRHKRLCAIHSALIDSSPGDTTVAKVALQQGFVELGRFSHYYHALFGEYPSETLELRGAESRGLSATHRVSKHPRMTTNRPRFARETLNKPLLELAKIQRPFKADADCD